MKITRGSLGSGKSDRILFISLGPNAGEVGEVTSDDEGGETEKKKKKKKRE